MWERRGRGEDHGRGKHPQEPRQGAGHHDGDTLYQDRAGGEGREACDCEFVMCQSWVLQATRVIFLAATDHELMFILKLHNLNF